MVTSLLKITRFTIISKSKYFKFILDYESSAFTRGIYKKYTAVLKFKHLVQTKPMRENTITNIMKVSVAGTKLKESEKKVYESFCEKNNSQEGDESKLIVSSEHIANVTGHRGINFLNDYDEADEEELR